MNGAYSCKVLVICFNDTATTEIYTLSLHDALPILAPHVPKPLQAVVRRAMRARPDQRYRDAAELKRDLERFVSDRVDISQDRKSTRLNSSHANISYAVFCLKNTNHRLFTSLSVYLT